MVLRCVYLYIHIYLESTLCEPVWPGGKAGKQKDLGSNPLLLSFLFKRCGLLTLASDFVHRINETLKWLSSLPILMQSHSGGDSVAVGI